MTQRHIFISYPPSDQDYAQQVADHLQAQGLTVWINDGKRRWPTIAKAIEAAGACLLIVSAEAMTKSLARERELVESLARPIFTIVRGEPDVAAAVDAQAVFAAPHDELPDTAFCDQLAQYVTDSLPTSDSSPSMEPVASLDDIPTDLDDIAEQPPTPVLVAATLAAPVAPIASNDDWQPIVRVINGMEMVLVPRGCFTMGDAESATTQTLHTRCIERAFWIGRYPVTTGQYLEAVRQNVCEISRWAGDFRFNDPEQPIVGIGWQDALKFAQWRQMRLPTETEWEYAARGPVGLTWPWGDEFVSDNLNYAANANGRTSLIGNRTAGASWVGAHDMSGNVWEWCLSAWRDDYTTVENNRPQPAGESRVLRGGSFRDDADQTRTTSRASDDPLFGNVNIGFRLVCMAPIVEVSG